MGSIEPVVGVSVARRAATLPSPSLSRAALAESALEALHSQAVNVIVHPMTALAGRRILIAEDEALIALEMEGVLEDLGCKVVGPASRVEEVLRHLEASRLDGALLDVNLRGQQVFGLLPKLMEDRIPVIITSGYDDATLFPESFRTVPRIAKPFDPLALRRLCVSVFAES